MSDIGPGDWVEATRTYPPDEWGDGVERGKIYRVREIEHDDSVECADCGDGGPEVIQLEGVRTLGGSGWCHCGLKPIYRPKPDAFTDLLKLPVLEGA